MKKDTNRDKIQTTLFVDIYCRINSKSLNWMVKISNY